MTRATHPGFADPLPASRGEGEHVPLRPAKRGEGGRRPDEGLVIRSKVFAAQDDTCAGPDRYSLLATRSYQCAAAASPSPPFFDSWMIFSCRVRGTSS